MRYALRGAHLVDADGEAPWGEVVVEGARIAAVRRAPSDDVPSPEAAHVIDATSMLLAPGFVDVHTHGGGGHSLHTTAPEEISAYARWVPTTGVTAFLIGVVGAPGALPEAQLRAATVACAARGTGAEPLGIHLEGPYINEKRRGAHSVSWLRQPDAAEIERVLALTNGHLRLVTLAPELPGAAALIRRLVAAGVTVSLGHTDATYEQALAAFALGATHVTHCCNAMRPLHHRDPGPLAAAAESAHVSGELIADGIHLHPAMVSVVVRLLGAERAIAITDALAAADQDTTDVEFAGQPARVTRGAARLADGTLAGSVLTMDQALRNVLEMAHLPLPAAIGMLTRNPARAAGAAERKGLLRAGYDADLVLLDESLAVRATICGGALVYATPTWRERLGAAAAPPAPDIPS